jgi:hypothetical protein
VSVEDSIFVYAEAPPLGENVVTHGLFRAATPMLRAIRDVIDVIALFPWDRHFRLAMLDPVLAPLCAAPPRLLTWLRLAGRRLGLHPLERHFAALLAGSRAARSPATHILCLEGSDPDVLADAAAVAARAGKPFSVYVVDDFLIPMRIEGVDEAVIEAARLRAQASLRQASHVFAISDGLGKLFEKDFGVVTTTLPLVFEPAPAPREPLRTQIIFVGSVNFLYADALRVLLAAVAEVRAESGQDLTVRFTSPSAASLGPLPGFVQVAPLARAADLAREISASLFAFLPYSFDAQVAEMVRTSFPSKLMEYLAYARSIVAFAPDYANSAAYFRDHALPELAHDRAALKAAILRHLRDAPVHSETYRRQLESVHAPQAARQIILSTLFGSAS